VSKVTSAGDPQPRPQVNSKTSTYFIIFPLVACLLLRALNSPFCQLSQFTANIRGFFKAACHPTNRNTNKIAGDHVTEEMIVSIDQAAPARGAINNAHRMVVKVTWSGYSTTIQAKNSPTNTIHVALKKFSRLRSRRMP
jgi:hypothetical protein